MPDAGCQMPDASPSPRCAAMGSRAGERCLRITGVRCWLNISFFVFFEFFAVRKAASFNRRERRERKKARSGHCSGEPQPAKAKRAYTWSHREGLNDEGERFVAVLEIGGGGKLSSAGTQAGLRPSGRGLETAKFRHDCCRFLKGMGNWMVRRLLKEGPQFQLSDFNLVKRQSARPIFALHHNLDRSRFDL